MSNSDNLKKMSISNKSLKGGTKRNMTSSSYSDNACGLILFNRRRLIRNINHLALVFYQWKINMLLEE